MAFGRACTTIVDDATGQELFGYDRFGVRRVSGSAPGRSL
jgi:hypothetical protein